MTLLTGLSFGRPAYPYYEPDKFTPQEPKSLAMLATLSAKTGKGVGVKEKDKNVKGTQIQEKMYYAMDDEIQRRQKDVFNRWKSLYDKDPSGWQNTDKDPLGWQNTDEGKSINEEIIRINQMLNIQASNPNTMLKNYDLLIKEDEKLNNPEMFAQNQYILTVDDKGDPTAVKKDVVGNDGKTYSVPIKKQDILNEMWTNPNFGMKQNGEVVLLDPPRAVNGLSGMKALNERYNKIQTAITETGGSEYVTPLSSDAAQAAQYAGKIMTYNVKGKDNYYALSANTVPDFLRSLNGEELESLQQTYVYLKENNPSALVYEYEEINKETKKTEKKTQNLNFNNWIGSLLINKNQLNTVQSSIIDNNLIDLPNAWGSGSGSSQSEIYTWPELAYELSGASAPGSVDITTGKIIPYLNWTIISTDIVENVLKLSPSDIKEALRLMSDSDADKVLLSSMSSKMLKAKSDFKMLSLEERKKYFNDPRIDAKKLEKIQEENYIKDIVFSGPQGEEFMKNIGKKYKSLNDKTDYWDVVNNMILGIKIPSENNYELSSLAFLDDVYTKKYGSSIATTIVPFEYQRSSAIYLRDLTKIDLDARTFGGMKLTNEIMNNFDKKPFINNIDQFGYMDGKGKMEPVFIVRVAVHKKNIDDIPVSYWDGKKYVETTYGDLNTPKKQNLGIANTITLNFSGMDGDEVKRLTTSGWEEGEEYYNVPMMVSGKNIITDFWSSAKQIKPTTSTYGSRLGAIKQGQKTWDTPGLIEY